MSEILNFSCPVDNCGRKFATQDKLDNHIKLRHPTKSNNDTNIKKQENENNKISENNNKKEEEIESKKKKIVEKKENKILNNVNNKNNINQNKEEKIEKLEKESNPIIDSLLSKINILENRFETESLELQKQFELPEIPDDIIQEHEKLEQDVDIEIKNNKNGVNNNIIEEETKNSKNDNESNNNEKNVDNNIKLNIPNKNYDKNKIITITEDLILSNSDSQNEDFEEITSLNLSKKDIASFMNNRNINFEEIPNLKIINLSYNWMTYTYDLRLFSNLQEVYINDNKIDDISFCEFLPQLKILNCENNEITYITSLKKCRNLKQLKLSLNKIQYLNSTLGVFKSLNLLEELTIKDNPFLSQIFAYKQYFLFEYQNLLKFENEDINDIDRDIAGRFVRKNNQMYKNTPIYNKVQNDDDLKDINEDTNNQTTFRVGNTIITKEMFVPYKGKNKNNNKGEEKNNKIKKKSKKEEENSKNKELKEIIKNQQKEIDDIKLELENINQLNKEYEIIIEDYKIKLEQKKLEKNKPIDNIMTTKNKELEKNKLLKELDMWKKEYLDLFNKINKSSLFPSMFTKDEIQNPKSRFLKNRENENNNFNINMNLNKSMPNKEIKKIIERPQTAQVRNTKPENFEDLCEGLKIMYSKNPLMDVVEEESSDEDDIEEKKEDKDINDIKEENGDEIDYDGNDIIPDDEIDELFRKSCADLQKMKDEIKYMNESMDKNENNILNNNINNKGGKTKLNPVIIKKENNPNFIGNKSIFGNMNKKNV